MKRVSDPAFKFTRRPLAGGETGYLELMPNEVGGDLVSIGTGFFARPEHYYGFASALAEAGRPVIIADTLQPLADEDPSDPIAYKARRLGMAVADAANRYGFGAFESTAHSFGLGYQCPLIDDAPIELRRINSVSGAMLGNLNIPRPELVRRVMSFCFQEALPNFSTLTGLVRSSGRAITHPADRLREFYAMRERVGYAIPYIRRAVEAGVKVCVFISPKDNLIDPEESREVAEPIVGTENVIAIHPNATHIAVHTHGPHVARVLLQHAA